MNNSKLYRNISLVSLFSLILFEYYSMSNLADMGDSFLRSFAKLVIEIFALFFLFIRPTDSNTRFFTLWMIWDIISTILFPESLSGISGIVYTWFPQAAFLVGYFCNESNPDTKKYVKIAVVPLLLIAIYFILNNPLNFMMRDGEKGVDNMIFYIVCLVPFIMLIDKDIYKGALLVICVVMAINSLKRNAMIMTALCLMIFIFSVLKEQKRVRYRNMIIIAVLFILGFRYIIENMSLSIEQGLLRFEAIQDDGGSGRDFLWRDCINALSRNDIVDWIIGHGYAGTMKVAKHTSAHNDLLTILIEQGLIGAVFYLVFIFRLIRDAWRLIKNKSYGMTSMLCMCVIVIFMGLFSNLVPLATYFSYITLAYGIIMSENKCIAHQQR